MKGQRREIKLEEDHWEEHPRWLLAQEMSKTDVKAESVFQGRAKRTGHPQETGNRSTFAPISVPS